MTLFTKHNFLLPTWGKLILAGTLFYLSGWMIWPGIIESRMTDWYPIGFPFTIQADGLCPPSYRCVEFNWAALIGDIVTWYLVSIFIAKIFQFIQRKNSGSIAAMKKFFIQRFMDFNIWLIRSSHGKRGTAMGGQTVLILNTTGRKSGQVRAVPISYFRDGERYFIVASNWAQEKNAAWYFNLKANPRATLEVKGESISVVAHEAEGEEYSRLWKIASAKYSMYENYQKSVERRIPIMVFEVA